MAEIVKSKKVLRRRPWQLSSSVLFHFHLLVQTIKSDYRIKAKAWARETTITFSMTYD
jgi:hypothetical protein